MLSIERKAKTLISLCVCAGWSYCLAGMRSSRKCCVPAHFKLYHGNARAFHFRNAWSHQSDYLGRYRYGTLTTIFLTLNMLGKHFGSQNFEICFCCFFPQNIDFHIPCKFSPNCKVFSSFFPGKIKEKILSMCRLLNLPRGW